MNKKPTHCKNCVLLSSFDNHRNLTEAQKRHNNWCCAKGQPAEKATGYCITHNLKKTAK